jgi:DNA-binding transcriptional ArsR family regulator
MEKGQLIGHSSPTPQQRTNQPVHASNDFVLEKSIFNNIFEKDIRKVFIYKKAERLAKAVHLIAPAFNDSMSLRSRVGGIAVGLVDAAILPSGSARAALSRELLALSSILAIARTSGLLSPMNADLITRETHLLLQEVAAYEEPRLSFEEDMTLSGIAKKAVAQAISTPATRRITSGGLRRAMPHETDKGHLKDRREAILSLIKDRKEVGIKDISTMMRDISEKTVQRELAALVASGVIIKHGERRWSTYSPASF